MYTMVLILLMQYAAYVGLYHSHPKRANSVRLVNSPKVRLVVRWAAILLLLSSLFLVATLQNWERGIPTYLCLISVTGLLSLFVSAYFSNIHAKSGLTALMACLFMGGLSLIYKTLLVGGLT